MNAALDIAIRASVVFCVIGVVVISCWLLLDWQREVRQARAARKMRDYCDDGAAEGAELVEAAECTWPIVAQQPQAFYEKAITIPIPRTVMDTVLPEALDRRGRHRLAGRAERALPGVARRSCDDIHHHGV